MINQPHAPAMRRPNPADPAAKSTSFKITDEQKIARILGVYGQKPVVAMEGDAMRMIIDYMDEVTCAVLEHAGMLAVHRKSNIVETKDIVLALGSCLF